MAKNPQTLHVVIIGGSIAGLLAGNILGTCPQIKSITIFERREQEGLRDLGAGFRLSPEVSAMIAHLTQQQPENYATWVANYRTVGEDGLILKDYPAKAWMSTWTGIYRVLKHNFESIPRCTYRHGCKVVDLTEQDLDTVTVHYTISDDLQHTALANFVVGADGISSTVRSLVDSESKRVSSGYVCYRGTADQSKLSPSTSSLFHEAGIFHWALHSQFLSYPVPPIDPTSSQPSYLINWIWYHQRVVGGTDQTCVEEDVTDPGYMRQRGFTSAAEIEAFKARAVDELPAPCHEVITQTDRAFVQEITDLLSKHTHSLNGKVLLIGDAVGGQRPHTASALSQAGYHALLLRALISGQVTLTEWAEETHRMSQLLVNNGRELGYNCMYSNLSSAQKADKHMKLFGETSMKTKAMWQAVPGIDELKVVL